MDDSCNICKIAFVSKDTCVDCSRCNFHFHIGCAGVPERFYKHFIVEKGTPWYCHICNVELRKETRKNSDAISVLARELDTVKSDVDSINVQIETVKASQQSSMQVLEHEILDKVNEQLASFVNVWSDKVASVTNDSPQASTTSGKISAYSCLLVGHRLSRPRGLV